MNLYNFVGNDGVNEIDILGLEYFDYSIGQYYGKGETPSFSNQTLFGPRDGSFVDQTGFLEFRYPDLVASWKADTIRNINYKISCEPETQEVDGERIEGKNEFTIEEFPPQSWFSAIFQLGSINIITKQPIKIHWSDSNGVTPSRTSILTGKSGREYKWSTEIWVSDGLGLDVGDGAAYYLLGDGALRPRPKLMGNLKVVEPPTNGISFLPDRGIIIAKWTITGYGVCPCK